MPVYSQGRSRETDDVLVQPAPVTPSRTPDVQRLQRATAPTAMGEPAPALRLPPAEPRAHARPEPGAPRGERFVRPNPAERADRQATERPDSGPRGQREERGERAGKPDPAEGRGRSTSEHRPRDQRERAQML